jgi:hypothetical protein
MVAGAFEEGLPRRDLLVSPDHAFLIDGKLIPARMLVNGMTVRDEAGCRSVTYYHVELDAHDVLLAEGLPAESYLDTGNRSIFENDDGLVQMRPQFADLDETARRAAGSCVPYSTEAAFVQLMWRRLAQRAEALGHAPPVAPVTTDDPDLHLMVNGRRLRPVTTENNRHVFVLPRGDGPVRLVSRSVIPADDSPWLDDRRRLGVMVRQITVRQGPEMRVIPMDHPMLNDGWWAIERNEKSIWRWSNGDANLGALPWRAILEVELAGLATAYAVEAAKTAVDSRQVA